MCEHMIWWQFPKHEDHICQFLKLYASVTLRTVYLSGMSMEIMNVLSIECPNLQTLDFVAAKWVSHISRGETFHYPPKLTRLRMTSPNTYLRSKNIYAFIRCKNEDSKIVTSLQNECPNLQHLTLRGFFLSAVSLNWLGLKANLKELELLDCKPCTHLNKKGCMSSETMYDDILSETVGPLTSLTRFRITSSIIHHVEKRHILHTFLGCIGQFEHLEELTLCNALYSEKDFEAMIPGIVNLKSLEVPEASSFVVDLIGKYLKQIKLLKLLHGKFACESLSSLAHHQTLEQLWIESHESQLDGAGELCDLLAIFDVLVTLPKIKYVKLLGDFDYTLESFPIIESAEIEVQKRVCVPYEEYCCPDANDIIMDRSGEAYHPPCPKSTYEDEDTQKEAWNRWK